MKLVTSTEDRIVACHSALLPFVLLGAIPLLLAIGIPVVSAMSGAAPGNRAAAAVILLSIGSFPVVWLGFTRPVRTRCEFNRRDNLVSIERLFLLRGTHRASWALTDLADVDLKLTTVDDGTTATFSLRFRSGDPVVVFDGWVTDREAATRACEALRSFARLPHDPAATSPQT
jgi:hypothetical protein